MPLPFRQDRPNLPDNKSFAIHCLKSLARKLQRDQKYYSDYVNFMEDIIARDTEKVPDKELNNHPVWYIPHHWVYHPQKPGKIVLSLIVQHGSMTHHDHLLTWPELTNT